MDLVSIDELPIDFSLSNQRWRHFMMSKLQPAESFLEFVEIEELLRRAEEIIQENNRPIFDPAQHRSDDMDFISSSLIPNTTEEQLNSTIDFGPLDIAINNASILLETSAENHDLVDSMIAESNSTEGANNANTLPIQPEQDDDVVFVCAHAAPTAQVNPPVVDLCTPIANKRTLRSNDIQIINMNDSVILIDDSTASPAKQPNISTAAAPPPNPENPEPVEPQNPKPQETEPEHTLICPICMGSAFHTKAAATTCGHIFCWECISTAVKFNKKCPLCNRTVTKKNYHRIFF